MNFSGKFGSASTIWYPASGRRFLLDGSLDYGGICGYYWSASPNSDSDSAYSMDFSNNGSVSPSPSGCRAFGLSVRCLKESK